MRGENPPSRQLWRPEEWRLEKLSVTVKSQENQPRSCILIGRVLTTVVIFVIFWHRKYWKKIRKKLAFWLILYQYFPSFFHSFLSVFSFRVLSSGFHHFYQISMFWRYIIGILLIQYFFPYFYFIFPLNDEDLQQSYNDPINWYKNRKKQQKLE